MKIERDLVKLVPREDWGALPAPADLARPPGVRRARAALRRMRAHRPLPVEPRSERPLRGLFELVAAPARSRVDRAVAGSVTAVRAAAPYARRRGREADGALRHRRQRGSLVVPGGAMRAGSSVSSQARRSLTPARRRTSRFRTRRGRRSRSARRVIGSVGRRGDSRALPRAAVRAAASALRADLGRDAEQADSPRIARPDRRVHSDHRPPAESRLDALAASEQSGPLEERRFPFSAGTSTPTSSPSGRIRQLRRCAPAVRGSGSADLREVVARRRRGA